MRHLSHKNVDKQFLKIDKINFGYSKHSVLTDISFSAGQGDIISIIGPNGSGKTTLLKIIIGLLEPVSGTVSIGGQSPKAIREEIAYVPQKYHFDRDIPLSVREFMGLDDCGHTGHGQEYIDLRLGDVGLGDVGHKKIGDLSGGQFQRVMVARALLHEKSVLAFDEPLAGIDMAGEATVYDLITKVNRENKTTCLIVSHELSVVNRYSNHVVCINNKICCSGKPAEVLTPQAIKDLYGEQAGLYHQH